jgi:predicted dehydrogenase
VERGLGVSGRRIRVGVIGCGEVTQIIHLPTLAQLGQDFEVTALCDVSPTVLHGVGDAWGVHARFADMHALVASADVDVVLVANPDAFHAEATLAAIAAGKDVLVEKPMCLGLRECDEIAAAAEAADAVVQVGYMRRHAPALAQAARELEDIGEIRFARVHDFIGANRLIIDRTSNVIRADDVGPDAAAAIAERRRALIDEAVGALPSAVLRAYDQLLGLASHDISAMRQLLGQPRGVAHATERQGGIYVTATIDYGSYVCHFESGVDEIPRFDAHIEVFGPAKVLRVQYDTPYVRNLPVRVTVLDANGEGGAVERHIHPQWGDPFVHEWQAFRQNVTERAQPRSSPQDFRRDLELFGEMIELMAVRTGVA